MSNDLINRRALCDDLREYKVHHIPVSSDESEVKGYNDGIDLAISVIAEFPSAEPERKTGRKFLEIVVNYPKVCTYPEYGGKPYYSIKYEENGEMIVGYGTYKPEVLSQYLREYFLPSAEPERKKGYWIVKDEDWRKQLEWDECSECGFVTTKQYNFCPNCGADMW